MTGKCVAATCRFADRMAQNFVMNWRDGSAI